MSLNENIAVEIQKLEPSSIIEVFELDATELGGEIFRFHNGTNELNQNLVWQGNEYIRFPIQVTGFELNGQGQFPRPVVSVSNVLSAITTILLEYNDLIGSKFTRKRTLLRYLDAVNFPDGTNPDADPTAFIPDDIYWVDRKSSEDRDQVQFELASAADLQNVQIPNRTVIKNSCPWAYRSAECSYTGVPLYDGNDNLIPMPPASEEARTMIDAWNVQLAAEAVNVAAQNTLSAASIALTAAQQYTLDTRYNIDPANDLYYVQYSPQYIVGYAGFWDGALVSLGSEYTAGNYEGPLPIQSWFQISTYQITKHSRDETALAAAQTDYNNALTARTAAQADVEAKRILFSEALAAVPTDDQIFKDDRCGKRLTSCQLRFGQAGPLPFGGFPGVSR